MVYYLNFKIRVCFAIRVKFNGKIVIFKNKNYLK